MDIIVVSHQRGRTWRMRLDVRHVLGWLPFALIAILLLSSSYAVGYWTRGGSSVVPQRLVATWAKEAEQQRAALGTAREDAAHNDADFSRRLAQLHAHVLRREAVGSTVTNKQGRRQGE